MVDLSGLDTTIDPEKLRQLRMLQPASLPGGSVSDIDLARQYQGNTDLGRALRKDNPNLNAMNTGTVKPIVSPVAKAPELSPIGPAPALTPIGEQPTIKPLSFKERQALPTVSAAAPAGSAASYQAQLTRLQDQKENPWGSAENHPGVLGKIGHVLGRVGNIAGDIVAPGTMALIPGTDLNKREQEAETTKNLETAQNREDREAAEQTREKEFEETAQGKKDVEEAKDSAALAKQGLKRDEQGNIVGDEESPVFKANQEKIKGAEELRTNLNAYRQAQTDLANARAELARQQANPNSPAFQAAQKKLEMAEQAHAIAAKNLELHEQQYQNKLQEQELVKPSGQATSRGSAAQAVLDVIPDLKNLVQQHRQDMGPLFGRIARGEVRIGDVDPGIARLYSAMKSFYALQPAVHGFKNAEFVKDFETAIGTLERDPDAFIAGMEGLKPTLQSVANEGKTYHKRIVEGRETPPKESGGSEPQRPANVPKNYVFKDGPKGKGWYKP